MNKIAVLVAVYNGREWIDEQLYSILSQKNADLDIYISVDLSNDGSWEYINEHYSKYSNVFLLPYGEKFGSAGKNFYRLILDTELNNYKFVAFSDQDDIWNDEKIFRATRFLESNNIDGYSSNVMAFWDNGKTRLIDKSQPQKEYDYYFEAAGPGCTYVVKERLIKHFKIFLNNEENHAKDFFLHDWLLYAFARYNNYQWHIDNWPSIMYRQHNENQVGANITIAARRKRFHLVKSRWYRKEVMKLTNLFPNGGHIRKRLDSGYVGNLRLCLFVNKIRRKVVDRIFLLLVLIFGVF